MTADFYRAFEERFRGSRELILERLSIYRPFIAPLKQFENPARTMDLGCGRGEWLELMLEEGFSPTGVDLDEGMLRACKEIGLPGLKADIFTTLADLEDESQVVVSAFHVVEHLSFEQLYTLVVEALRVLKPGGLLIMETPNPENIVVGSCNFYIDPTHQKPIPSLMLGYLTEYAGFVRNKIVRAQHAKELEQRELIILHDVLAGVSLDYAVVAQKSASTDVMKLFDVAFAQDYGFSFGTLAARYESRVVLDRERIEIAVRNANECAQQTRDLAVHVDEQLQETRRIAQQAHETLCQVYASRSWQCTAPLRWISWQIKLVRSLGVKARIKAFLKKLARKLYAYIASKPRMKMIVIAAARRMGALGYLKELYVRISKIDKKNGRDVDGMVSETTNLTPSGQKVYLLLRSAQERKERNR